MLAITAMLVSHAAWWPGGGRAPGATASVSGVEQYYWLWIPLIGGALILAVSLSIVLRSRMRRDFVRLRAAIRQMGTPGRQFPPSAFAIEELCECATELASTAERLRQEQVRLSDDAARDPLTGLSNRRPFMDTLVREAAFANRTGWPLSLIMVDLDHFKALNDTYGHSAGDTALRRTADRLSSLVRQSDSVARLGGEEFGVVLPGTRLGQATRIAQQLCDALRGDQFVHEGKTIRVTASFGVAEVHECRATDSESLMGRADAALYDAKHNGRDTVVAAPTAPSVEFAVQDAQQPDEHPTDAAAGQPESVESDTIDRDTLALMGSTFSVLRVIPDRHRVAHDLVQQVAAVLQSPTAALYPVSEAGLCLDPLVSTASGDDSGVCTSDELQAWVQEWLSSSHPAPSRALEPTQTAGIDETTVVRIPLIADGEILGVIEAAGLAADFQLAERQRMVLSALAAIGATALKNCDAYEGVVGRMCGLIEALSKAVHAQDAYKRDHCERVSAIAVGLAQKMGQQDAEELQLVRIAGLVHDIGNAGLPLRLFQKHGRFRDGERKLMQQHCGLGAEIIGGVAEMERLAEIVRHHHEQHDGRGYPQGLAGCAIPFESRLLAVADAYVAMTSPRPYRPALSHDEAVRRIEQGAGEQFDPAIVDAFLEWVTQSEFAPNGSSGHSPPPVPAKAAFCQA